MSTTPEHLKDHNNSFPLIQEKFPHIATRLLEYDSLNQCVAYLESLLETANAEGNRRGFPPEVISALFSILSHIHGYRHTHKNELVENTPELSDSDKFKLTGFLFKKKELNESKNFRACQKSWITR